MCVCVCVCVCVCGGVGGGGKGAGGTSGEVRLGDFFPLPYHSDFKILGLLLREPNVHTYSSCMAKRNG